MSPSTPSFARVVKELEHWSSYESTSRPRDISRLEGIIQLLKTLGQPHKNLRVIHIAGTNGKGLTAFMLGKLLSVEGKTCGIYNSPHISNIRERINLNGEWISKLEFALCGEKVLEAANCFQGDPYLSYFDLLTAIAFYAFYRTGVEHVILETGLGGRLDSTNVTEKELCILTKIGIDHQKILGHSLKQIAKEKLGITRRGVPLVLARQHKDLNKWLIKELGKNGVPVLDVENELSIQSVVHKNNSMRLLFKWKDGRHQHFPCSANLSLPKLECMRNALVAVDKLFKINPSELSSRLKLIEKVHLPARLELRSEISWAGIVFKNLVLDGGHNADSLEALAIQISKWNFNRCTIMLALAKDKLTKDLITSLPKLLKTADLLLVSQFNSSRSATPDELKKFLENNLELKKIPSVVKAPTPRTGLEIASLNPDKPFVIAGSFYLSGEIINLLG